MVNRRKVPSSSAAISGALTRSKADVFLHRTRSGQYRPDPRRPHNQQPKDLRLKRVFSRIEDRRIESEDLDVLKGSTDDDSGETAPPDPEIASEINGRETIRVSEETNLGKMSENSVGLSPCLRPKVIGNPSCNSYRRLLPYLKDLVKDGSLGIHILQSHNLLSKTLKTSLLDVKVVNDFNGGKGVRVSKETNLGNSVENKQVPSQYSRSKLVVNRSSINYRRLLPYLKDLDKKDPSGTEIFQSHDHSPKVEETANEAILVLDPSYDQQNNVAPLRDFPIVISDGNCNLTENPILENTILNSQEEIVQNPRRIESPIHELTSKVRFDDDHMNKLNGQEQEGTNKERCISDAENSKVSAACSDDMAQSTPPDVNLTRKLDDVENGSRRTILELELNNTSKESMGLALCSRSKLYRNSSSFSYRSNFSYRRLLPHLMDLAKNDPKFFNVDGLEIIHSHNHTAKVHNCMEARPSMLNDIPSPRQQDHTATLDDSLPVHLKENQDLEGNCVSESLVLDSQSDIHDPKTTELSKLGNTNEVKVLSSMDQISPKRLDFEFEMCKSSSRSPTISEDLSFEELAGDVIMETDRRHSKKASLNQALAPRKSILKKQSRRCQGICMCLDCASFRVHAERAYEFSRRQLSDVDEVVERLLKELSCLRKVTERSLLPAVDCDGNYIAIQVNQEQVKRDCQRVLSVEEQARSRMMQMFCDLNAHCKIPGSRVAFSDTVDERVIP